MKVLSIRVVRIGLITLTSLLVGGVMGCSPMGWLKLAWSSPPTISIREIPQKKSDRIVYLQGKVIDRVPFIDSGSYQLQDATGAVWILTNKGLPAIGEELLIKGQIEYQPIPIGRQDIGEFYVLELEKLTPAPESPNPPTPSPLTPAPVLPPQPQPTPPPSPAPSPLPSPSPPPSSIVIPVPIAPSEPSPTPTPKPTPSAQPTPAPKPSNPPQPQTPSQTKPETKPPSKPNLDERYFPHKRNNK